MIRGFIDLFKKLLGINSPSTVFADISWAIPIITRLLNLITQLAGALANLTAGWFGKTAQQAQDNAKALNSQAKATAGASKATKSLMSIDEINQLSDKSGGGSSSASPTFNNDLSFDASGWFENLGTDIATKINEAIASVDWLELGHKVGKSLQKMLNVSLDFLRTINFKDMGKAIANFINGAINEVHPAQIGEALWRVFKTGYDLLVGFITTFDWKQFGMHLLRIAKSIAIQFAETMREIDWQGIANRVYTFMRDFFSQQDWWEIAKNVLQGLANGLLGLVTILWNASASSTVVAYFNIVDPHYDTAYQGPHIVQPSEFGTAVAGTLDNVIW